MLEPILGRSPVLMSVKMKSRRKEKMINKEKNLVMLMLRLLREVVMLAIVKVKKNKPYGR